MALNFTGWLKRSMELQLKKSFVLFCLILATTSAAAAAAAAEEPPWVSIDRTGTGRRSHSSTPKLKYRRTSGGDQIMDFSAVGYKAGAHPIPYPPIKIILHPSGNDDTQQLQNAIDTVSTMQLLHSGLRGTIKLAPGTFNLGKKSIIIAASGVVIDGSGIDKTVINAHSLPAKVLFRLSGSSISPVTKGELQARIVETVPSGSSKLKLDRVEQLQPGDAVLVTWQWSPKWIKMMNMTEYWSPRMLGFSYTAERVVESVSRKESTILLDVPLPFRIDVRYLDEEHYGAFVQKMVSPIGALGRISNVGLQNFKAVKEAPSPGTGCFLKMSGVEDSWLSDLALHDFSGTIEPKPTEFLHTTLAIGGKRITVQNLLLHRSVSAQAGPKPFDIALHRPGQQILVKNVVLSGDREYSLITGDGIAGPNVFYNCTGLGTNIAQPHMLFATGLLYDNVRIPQGGIELVNRRSFGSGHGIAAGFSVAWNTESASLQVINPPEAANWALGCRAREINNKIGSDNNPGFVEKLVGSSIPSLYLAQRHS